MMGSINSSPDLSSSAVLVVREDPNLDRYFRDFGERFGFEFLFCTSILNSFITLESANINCVFWFRPVDDVLDEQTFDELRSIVELTSVPILVTVSKEELSEIDPFSVAETGVLFLMRPFEPIELVSALSGICRFCKQKPELLSHKEAGNSAGLLQPSSDPVLKGIVKRAEKELRWASTIIRAALDESIYLALSDSDRQLFFRHTVFKTDYCVNTFSDLVEAVEHGAGGRPATLRITNLERIIVESVGTISEIAKQQGIQFAVRFDRPVPKRVVTDGAKLRQALRAMLSNALSGTVYGRVELRVDYDRQQQILIFRTCDTGSGAIFPKSNKSFSMVPERSDNIEDILINDGIVRTGLSVTAGVARSLHGEFLIETIPDIGTTARLAIPAKEIAGSGEIQFVSSENLVIFDKNPFLDDIYRRLSGRVLIAIKDRVHEKMFRSYLASTKLDITSVHTSDEVRQALFQNQFDLLFIDIDLSFEGGKTLVNQLRQIGVLTPIVALSSSPSQSELERCVEVGCDAFLTLPVLLKPLARVLALHTVGAALRCYSSEYTNDVTIEYEAKNASSLLFEESVSNVSYATTSVKAVDTLDDNYKQEPRQFNEGSFFNSLSHQCKLLKLHVESHNDYRATGTLARELANLAAINKEVELEECLFALEAACLQGIAKRINAALSQVDLAVQALIKAPLQKEVEQKEQQKERPSSSHHTSQKLELSRDGNTDENVVNTSKSTKDSTSLTSFPAKQDVLVSTVVEASPELVPLISEFLDSLDVYLERIKAAVLLNDWPRLSSISHECAGVASMYGYPDLARLTSSIQEYINLKDVNKINLILLDIDQCIKAMKAGKEKLTLISSE